MNNLENLYSQSSNVMQFSKGYFSYLKHLFDTVDIHAISLFINELERAHKNDQTIFIIGNGGSASTASHLANDLGIGIYRKSKINKPLRVISLTDNISVITAISNDESFESVFLKQLILYFKKGDVLIAISASGNSRNIIDAVEWGKKNNGVVIGLTGFDGGRLRELSDISINIDSPKNDYGPVEDLHLIIGHLVSVWLQYSMTAFEEKTVKDLVEEQL